MPLPAGVPFDGTQPRESWPLTKAKNITTPSLGPGRSPPARVAPDGTRWCAYGDHTLDPNSKTRRCERCAAIRDRDRHTPVAAQPN